MTPDFLAAAPAVPLRDVRHHAFNRLLLRQHGLFHRAQARELGISPGTIRKRVEQGRWQHVVGEVFAAFSGPRDELTELRAALLHAGPDAALAELTVLQQWRFRYLPPVGGVHVLVSKSSTARSVGYVRVHRTARPYAVHVVNGLPMCAKPRAVIDACLRLRAADQISAILTEAVQARNVQLDDLVAEFQQSGRQRRRLIAPLLADVAAGARSVPEAKVLRRLVAAALPAPYVNVPLMVDGVLVAVPDFWWAIGLVVEIDGREWHERDERTRRRTRRRDRRYAGLRLTVLVFTAQEIRDDPEAVVAEIAATYAALVRDGVRPTVPLTPGVLL